MDALDFLFEVFAFLFALLGFIGLFILVAVAVTVGVIWVLLALTKWFFKALD